MSSIWRRLVTRPETWCGNAQGPHHANHTHHVGMPSHAVRQVPCQAAGTHRVPCHTSSRQWATSGVGRTSISIQQSSLLPPQFFNRARCRADSCASRTECWRPETPPATAASMSCPQCQQVNMSTSAVLGNLHVRQHPTRTRPQGRTSSECVQPATVPEAAITFSSLRTLLTAVVLTCSCGALMLAAPPPAAASVPLQPDALRAAYRQALHSVPPEAQIGAQISHQPAPATSYAGSEGEREGSLVAGRWTGGAQSGVVRQRADTHPQQADGSSRAPGAEAAADAAISAGSTLPVGASVPGAPAAAAVAGGEAAPPRRLTVAEQAQEAIAALEAARADVDGGRFPEVGAAGCGFARCVLWCTCVCMHQQQKCWAGC